MSPLVIWLLCGLNNCKGRAQSHRTVKIEEVNLLNESRSDLFKQNVIPVYRVKFPRHVIHLSCQG